MDTASKPASRKPCDLGQCQGKGPPAMPISLYEANPSMAQRIKQHLQGQVTQTPGRPHSLAAGLTSTTIQIPELRKLAPELQRIIKDNLFDQDIKETLKRAKALNWCRNIKPLYPLRTMG